MWVPRSKTDGLGLAREALDQLGVVGDLGDHDLQGHVALQHRVVGQVHHAHRALAERADDLVLADPPGQLPDDGGGFRLRLLAHRRGDGTGEAMRAKDRLETTPGGVKDGRGLRAGRLT
ncbi:MAG: hypothetical protein DMF81_01855 [Acidobacteria bacterium]|nr:MAG: hypothetical protein DMF81_01855 [Acidobacteriota bacterium]